MTHATALQKDYSTDLSGAFPVQLVTCIFTPVGNCQTVICEGSRTFVDYAAGTSAFTDVVSALLLFLTLPVTVATAERSFPKLRLIKSYLRNTMGQDRLCALAVLSIEAKSAQLMKTDKRIDCFASAMARTKTLSGEIQEK